MRVHSREQLVVSAEMEILEMYINLQKDTYVDPIPALTWLFVNTFSENHLPDKAAFHIALESAVLEIFQKYALTPGERMQIIHSMLGTQIKYLIRHERHGDCNKAGGLE